MWQKDSARIILHFRDNHPGNFSIGSGSSMVQCSEIATRKQCLKVGGIGTDGSR